jgi:hypothetical protein
MAAPWNKTFNRERNMESNFWFGCWYLDWKQGSSGKQGCFRRGQDRGDSKVLSNVLPGCFTFVKTVSRQTLKVERFKIAIFLMGPGILVYTVAQLEKFTRRFKDKTRQWPGFVLAWMVATSIVTTRCLAC